LSDEKENSVHRTPCQHEGEHSPCFGIPDLVCPRNEEGIIEPQPECVSCAHLKACLRKAVEAQGLVRGRDPNSPTSRIAGFFKRWSRRKRSHKEPDSS